jgi:hypothetical protein
MVGHSYKAQIDSATLSDFAMGRKRRSRKLPERTISRLGPGDQYQRANGDVGLVALLIAVFPANHYMAMHPVEAGAAAIEPVRVAWRVHSPTPLKRAAALS